MSRQQAEALFSLCEEYIDEQRISCRETIYQCDRVIQSAYEFIQKVCDIVGYYESEDFES